MGKWEPSRGRTLGGSSAGATRTGGVSPAASVPVATSLLCLLNQRPSSDPHLDDVAALPENDAVAVELRLVQPIPNAPGGPSSARRPGVGGFAARGDGEPGSAACGARSARW